MNQPERMCLESADGQESYVAMVHVTPAAVSFKMGFTFAFNRESVRQVCERLLVLLGPKMVNDVRPGL